MSTVQTPAVLETALSTSAHAPSIALEVTLRNTGAEPLWVNKRFLLNSAHAPAPFRELWLRITGPGGTELPFESKVRAGPATATDYVVLLPGQELKTRLDLARHYDFATPGEYRVTCHYADGTPEVPAPPEGTSHLLGILASAGLELFVERD